MRPGSLTWIASKLHLPKRRISPFFGAPSGTDAGAGAGRAGAGAAAAGNAGTAGSAGAGAAGAVSAGAGEAGAGASGVGTGGASGASGAWGAGGSSLMLGATSPHGLLLAPAHHLVQGDIVDLDDLVAHARQVAVRAARPPADAFDEDLVVLVDEVDRPVAHGESRDLPAVLDELDLHALADRRVRLLGLDSDLFEHDAAGLGRRLEGVGLLLEVEDAPLVVPVGPAQGLPVLAQLPRSVETRRLAHLDT